MGPIQSIIVFNGGSAGDFIKSVSIEQLELKSIHRLTDKGMIEFKNHYFKLITTKWFEEKFQLPIEVDNNEVFKVENTHYYHECFRQFTDNIFYIDYPETLQPLIVKLYIKKRWETNIPGLIRHHLASIPEGLRQRVTPDNIEQILNILWNKNIKNWRTIPELKKIELQDLLNYDCLKLLVEDIIQGPVVDPEQLLRSQQLWVEKNQELVNFFRIPSDSI